MTKPNYVLTALVALAAVSLLVLAFGNATNRVQGAVYDATYIGNATTSAAISVTASTRVLASTTNPTATSYTRAYAVICNPSATIVALNLDGDKAANALTGNVTTFIGAAAGHSVCYEVNSRNLYQGSITASSTVGAVTVYVKDYVQ